MLGSLQWYRNLLYDHVFSHPAYMTITGNQTSAGKLPTIGHAVAGVLAGSTVSFIASPVEHMKARLQIQYAAKRDKRFYKGPIDCLRKIVCSFYDCRPQVRFKPLLTEDWS